MNIVGLGGACCRIAKHFEIYPQYKTFFIDTDKEERENFFRVEQQKTHEDYEAAYKQINTQRLVGETTLITTGSGNISGILLRLLEQLKDHKLTVLYIRPDMSTAPEDVVSKESMVFGILQEYARSNLLSRLFVVSNTAVESVLDKISIVDYWKNLNTIISSTFHMLNVFDNTEPLLSTLVDPKETSRIATFGVVAFDNLDEKVFYNLQKPRLKKYFFGVTEKTLNEERDLLQKIRSCVKDRSEEKCTACFAIYSTDYEQNYAYVVQYASLIQEQNLDS